MHRDVHMYILKYNGTNAICTICFLLTAQCKYFLTMIYLVFTYIMLVTVQSSVQ